MSTFPSRLMQRARYQDQLRLCPLDAHGYSMTEASVSCARHQRLIETARCNGVSADKVARQLARLDVGAYRRALPSDRPWNMG